MKTEEMIFKLSKKIPQKLKNGHFPKIHYLRMGWEIFKENIYPESEKVLKVWKRLRHRR